MSGKVKNLIGDPVVIKEQPTPEEIEAKAAAEKAAAEQAERDANGGKTLAEIEAEKAAAGTKTPEEIAAEEEAARKAEEDAKKYPGKTPEEIATLKAEEEAAKNNDKVISIENAEGVETEYTLNEAGDALDGDGKVIYTAAQIAEFEANNDDEDTGATIEDISKISGVQILDDKGEPKAYETSVEGFAQREVDVKQAGYAEGEQKALDAFFKANPEFESMAAYKRTYGSLDNYSEYVDYSKITLSQDNEGQLVDVIVKAELAKGASPERAQRLANFSKTDGTLLVDAQESLAYLNKNQEADRVAAEKRDQEAVAKAIEEDNTYYGIGYDKDGKEQILNVEGSVYDAIVTKGVIGNIMLPKDGITVKDTTGTAKHLTRRNIFDYIYTPVAEIDGEVYSQAQIDEYKRLSSKDELMGTYIRNLLGGDVSQLIEVSKRKDNAKQIRRFKIKAKQSASSSGGRGSTKKVKIPIK